MSTITYEDALEIMGGNPGALTAIGGAKDNFFALIQQFMKYDIRGPKIWCIYKHMCNGNTDEFVQFVLKMDSRPTVCPDDRCDWSVDVTVQPDGADPEMRTNRCMAMGCDKESRSRCGACFSVTYCSKECLKRDRGNHKGECKKLVNAVKMAADHGKNYTRTVIMDTINIDVVNFDKLWRKYGK